MKFPTAARRAATIAARATTNNNAAKQSKAKPRKAEAFRGGLYFAPAQTFSAQLREALVKNAHRLASDKYRFSKNAQ